MAKLAAENLHQSLYLNPNFRVVIETGGHPVRDSAAAFASVLRKSGCGDVPMSAIRSQDLLDRYEQLIADPMVKLAYEDDDQAIAQLMPVAAHVEQDAEPIAAALGQGAKVVFVERCFPDAPLVAAGRWRFANEWSRESNAAASAVGYLLGHQRQGFEFAESVLATDQHTRWPVVELTAEAQPRISPVPEYQIDNFPPARGSKGLTAGAISSESIVLSEQESGAALDVSVHTVPQNFLSARAMIRYENGWQVTAYLEWGPAPESYEEVERFLATIRQTIKPLEKISCSYDLEKRDPSDLYNVLGVYASGLSDESSVSLSRLIKSYDGDITCTRSPDDRLAYFDLPEAWATWSLDVRPAEDWVE